MLPLTTESYSIVREDIVMDILTRRDTTHAIVDCGDFHLNMDAHGGYKKG